ncbi:MAG TPA: hypothetical protein PLQ13_06730 [Candidatus Krumholzibacteria bacterium]|nr:hypothetical protein [Candidatus Krumholzibacteria bacterium]
MRTTQQFKALAASCRCRDATMAHRRPLVRGSAGRMLACGAGVALVIASGVIVSSEVTRLRARVGDLEDRKACVEAESADLARRWTEATGPGAVIARAEAELGLVLPSQPDFVLVAAPAGTERGDGFLARVLGGLAGGPTADAAQPPVFVSGRMVSLDPAADDAADGNRR